MKVSSQVKNFTVILGKIMLCARLIAVVKVVKITFSIFPNSCFSHFIFLILFVTRNIRMIRIEE